MSALVDRDRPEGVAEVVEAQLAQAGALERRLVAIAELLGVDVATRAPRKTRSSSPVDVLALAEPCEGLSDLVGHRHGLPCRLRRAHRRRSVAPRTRITRRRSRRRATQGQQLARAESRESRGQEDRRVLLRFGRPHQGPDLLGERTSISTLGRTRGRSTSSTGLRAQPMAALRVPEDRRQGPTRYFWTVRFEGRSWATHASRQRSIVSVVMSSSGSSPSASSRRRTTSR